jgi:hypothetical protein
MRVLQNHSVWFLSMRVLQNHSVWFLSRRVLQNHSVWFLSRRVLQNHSVWFLFLFFYWFFFLCLRDCLLTSWPSVTPAVPFGAREAIMQPFLYCGYIFFTIHAVSVLNRFKPPSRAPQGTTFNDFLSIRVLQNHFIRFFFFLLLILFSLFERFLTKSFLNISLNGSYKIILFDSFPFLF